MSQGALIYSLSKSMNSKQEPQKQEFLDQAQARFAFTSMSSAHPSTVAQRQQGFRV